MPLSRNSEELIQLWLFNLRSQASLSLNDDPGYYLYRPQSLITSSQPQQFMLGNGEQICANIFDAFGNVQHEILFVTCFWAQSASQTALASALKSLSARAVASNSRIRVRIGFSSSSLWQKLTQTSSLSGKVWPSSLWPSSLGLPDAAELVGLDITIRSIFVWPLSVMHPKFVICDRQKLFLPSCNVSWEEWLEGCIELQGDIVTQALVFWETFWGRDEILQPLQLETIAPIDSAYSSSTAFPSDLEQDTTRSSVLKQAFKMSLSQVGTVRTICLPSPHHQNPCFRPYPFYSTAPPPPPTPLNSFLLTVFAAAEQSIYVQSANITSQPVLDALLAALHRGVKVQIVSNEKMQVVEQLLTSGRLTEWALDDLWRQHSKMNSMHRLAGYLDDEQDLEAGRPEYGTLEISYFQPPQSEDRDENEAATIWAMKSHLKLTVVDGEIVVLGSGNMDRASWYTSQELGIAFFSRNLAQELMQTVQSGLEGRLERWH